MNLFDSNRETKVRILMLEIRSRINSPVEINSSTARSLYFNLITESYDTIAMYHGQEFAIAVMELYAECELFEVCAIMRDKIEKVKILEEKLNKENIA